MPAHRVASLAILTLVAALAACRPAASPPAAPADGPRLESAALGIALARVPAPFRVASAGDPLVLVASGATATARLTLSAGPREAHGINLLEAVKARRAAFEALPGGHYHGNRELGTPNGPAFTARGSWDGDGGRIEETWIFTLHPESNRLLTLVYRYAPAEAKERAGQALAVLGEIEGLAGADPAAATAAPPPGG